uniref:Beta-hexosaminidase n=1 Tax=Candidatus Kentrum sp. LPFa TaxID=2126335 RepID=A0A450XU90_9GAMM|nr:MAG: beta-N-acetylhexosaminidase [Candidatus Kentron sp. LPFa]VFK32828.1 MAG: beta-N-acetylhexosaminidase [Candidatus Kentron sp. LPFa]
MTHGPIMLDLQDLELSAEERELLRHPAVGGVILFARNYQSPEQITELIRAIRQARTKPLLVALDQEGGRVQRLREGFTRLPPAAWYGQCYRRQAEAGLTAAREGGWLMAAELRAIDVDFSFAPVADLDGADNPAIGARAFAQEPRQVAILAEAWMRGAREAGMPSVAKHFPGHGGVAADSHVELPRDDRTLGQLWHHDLLPFRHLIARGVEAIMPGHLLFEAFDAQPVVFSRYWLQDVLRDKLRFTGPIVTDDLNMQGITGLGEIEERCRYALAASCDLLLVCNDRPSAIRAIEALAGYSDQQAQHRLLRLQGNPRITHHALGEQPRWRQAARLLADYTPEQEQMSDPTTLHAASA